MKINRYKNTKEEKLRAALGLPSTDELPNSRSEYTSKDQYAVCENTISYASPVENGYKLLGAKSRLEITEENNPQKLPDKPRDNSFHDYGASGGATSPNTEVNADSQGVVDETGFPQF